VLDRLKAGEQALVPSFWPVEVLNVLLVGERRGRSAPEQTQAFFEALRALNPNIDPATVEQVAGPVQRICRAHRLAADYALYVELALRANCPLATLDEPQREAAQALGVHCL
jgi:predicted nucleic acid-binding protein